MTPRRTTPTALPIYVQISEMLIREIAAGRLVDGERLPPERDMAKHHGTTVRTLRKSLNELEKKGLLERIQGSGNYIRHSTSVESIYSMFRLELINGGGLPTADVLSVDRCDKPSDLPDFGTAKEATRIRRLRFLNQTPIAVEEIWLDGDAGCIAPDALQDSLYQFYRRTLGFWISRAQDSVSIGAVPRWSPDEFGLPAGQITGYIERLSWAQSPVAVEYSRTWFDTNQARYVQRLI